MEKKKVLIIEDEIIVAMDLELRLLKKGLEVLGICRNYEEALEVFTGNSVDVVFFDVNIEGEKTGIDIAKEFRTMNDKAKFVFITAYSNPSLLEDISAIDGVHIKKPFKEEQIEEILAGLS